MPEFVKVAKTSQVPEGKVIGVEVDGTRIVIANVAGKLFALGNECTCMGAPLDEGFLDGSVLVCPWHVGEFHVETGEALRRPAIGSIPTYQVRVEGGDIEVERPSQSRVDTAAGAAGP